MLKRFGCTRKLRFYEILRARKLFSFNLRATYFPSVRLARHFTSRATEQQELCCVSYLCTYYLAKRPRDDLWAGTMRVNQRQTTTRSKTKLEPRRGRLSITTAMNSASSSAAGQRRSNRQQRKAPTAGGGEDNRPTTASSSGAMPLRRSSSSNSLSSVKSQSSTTSRISGSFASATASSLSHGGPALAAPPPSSSVLRSRWRSERVSRT